MSILAWHCDHGWSSRLAFLAGGGVGVTCATRPGRDPRNSHDGKTVTILHISFCQSDHHNSILKQKKVLYYLIFFSGLSVYPQVLILRLLAPSWWWMFFGTKLIGSFHWRNGLDVIEKKNKKQTKYSDSREFTPFYTSPPINPSIFSFRDGWVHQGWCLWHCQWNRVRHQHGVQIALIPKTGSMNTLNQVRFVLGWVDGRCCFGAKNWKGTKLERDGEPGTRKLMVQLYSSGSFRAAWVTALQKPQGHPTPTPRNWTSPPSA